MNQQEQERPPEDNYFDVCWDSSEGHTIDDMRQLKDIDDFEDRGIPRNFEIRNFNTWTRDLLRSILEVLHHFEDKAIQWEEFRFIDNEGHVDFAPILIVEANKLSLFKTLNLDICQSELDPSDDKEFFLPGLSLNKRLQTLKMGCGGSMTHADSLGLCDLLKTTSSLKTLELIGMDCIDASLFSQGLQGNSTLEKVMLDFDEHSHLSDKEMSDIIEGLASLPKLKTLDIYTDSEWGSKFGCLVSRAFENLIAHSTSLLSLNIKDFAADDCERLISCENIFKGLKESRTLKVLQVKGIFRDEMILPKLFDAWSQFSSLETIVFLDSQMISSWRDFELVSTMKRLNRPMTLQLEARIIDQYSPEVETLLLAHPEVMMNGIWFEDFVRKPESFQHIYAFNGNGRYLMDRPNFPLSLWPRVLENADFYSATLLFKFLRGRALAQRKSLDFGRYLIHQQAKAPLSIWPRVLEKANYNASALFSLLKDGPAFAGEARRMQPDTNAVGQQILTTLC
jgi:hypothetical protein